jgi:hypothetical protein
MKRAVFPILSLALGVIFTGAFRSSKVAPSPTMVRQASIGAGSLARAFAAVVTTAPEPDDRAALRRRVREHEAGTYISDILNERDSSLARWPNREDRPLTVWIQPWSPVADFTPALAARTRDAFIAWDALDLPVRFAFVSDSADAEVHVTWIDHFSEPISGRTRWSRDDDWVITDANIILAVHHHQGDLLDEESMRAMAMHEIGHLLGLDHTRDSSSIMAPKVRVRDLSSADRATVKLIYDLPAGPLK